MTAITFTSLDFTGTPDDSDIQAAKMIINQENVRRAALETPETPLPMSTGAELKASYLELVLDKVTRIHASYAKQAAERSLTADAKQLWSDATQAQRDAAVVALGG